MDKMDEIAVGRIKTGYGYLEDYWLINGEPITAYVDRQKTDSLSVFGSLLGLLPAWSGRLTQTWENDFVWELVDSPEEGNVPILVCEDDCDLSCILIVAHIRKERSTVHWDSIGAVNQAHRVEREYAQSGILCLEAYTDGDWQRYGTNIALEEYGSQAYWHWVNEHCHEEYIRRLRNYLKPYIQREDNIEWLGHPHWSFRAADYDAVVEEYRKLSAANAYSVDF